MEFHFLPSHRILPDLVAGEHLEDIMNQLAAAPMELATIQMFGGLQHQILLRLLLQREVSPRDNGRNNNRVSKHEVFSVFFPDAPFFNVKSLENHVIVEEDSHAVIPVFRHRGGTKPLKHLSIRSDMLLSRIRHHRWPQ